MLSDEEMRLGKVVERQRGIFIFAQIEPQLHAQMCPRTRLTPFALSIMTPWIYDLRTRPKRGRVSIMGRTAELVRGERLCM